MIILKSIAIEEKGVRVERIDMRKLGHLAAGVQLIGQVFDMRNIRADSPLSMGAGENFPEVSGLPSDASDEPDMSRWIWTGGFLKFTPGRGPRAQALPAPSPMGKAIRKTVALKVGSHICKPINPRITDIRGWLTRTSTTLPDLNVYGRTWDLSDSELKVIADVVWDAVQTHSRVAALPALNVSEQFPYKGING